MTSAGSKPYSKKKRQTSPDSTPQSQSGLSEPSSPSFSSPGMIPHRLTAQRSVPAFLNKLYNMVEDATTKDLIRWATDGASFIVERHEEFAKAVLPRFYKHNTFASFVRQLNMYDFHKVPHIQQGVLIADNENEIWEFSNPHFQRERPDLLALVTRKRSRERDTVESDSINIATLVKDISAIRKHQTTISSDISTLHSDNEVLWKETLSSREKQQQHQDAIEKILQFLTTIFSNDKAAIGMNPSIDPDVPTGLIKEAATLAGISVKPNDKDNGMYSSSLQQTMAGMLASTLRSYSTNNAGSQQNYRHQHPDIQPTYSSRPLVSHMGQNGLPKDTNIDIYSQTLNTATDSAQSISRDIDDLQSNIESLAADLGIDPTQFAEDFVMQMDQYENNFDSMMSHTARHDRLPAGGLVGDVLTKDMYEKNIRDSQTQAMYQQCPDNIYQMVDRSPHKGKSPMSYLSPTNSSPSFSQDINTVQAALLHQSRVATNAVSSAKMFNYQNESIGSIASVSRPLYSVKKENQN
ncbi:hypothetical protein CLU79DRAFT_692662 [Phycomyces nitens]|nr:hypothetical protein CLU79DRAFT_692662 [Phycomyces nitens]